MHTTREERFEKGRISDDSENLLKLPRRAMPGVDTTKPTAVFKRPSEGRLSTLSIALPGSIMNVAQSFELKVQLIGRIARAAAVFCVDEIVIFDDGEKANEPDTLLQHLLVYLDCPPYLRRKLFPIHDHLRAAGLLPSLDMPHHLRRDEWCQYREGVTLPRVKTHDDAPGKKRKLYEIEAPEGRASKKSKRLENDFTLEKRTYVDCGFPFSIPVAFDIEPFTRVTLRFPSEEAPLGHDLTSPMWYNIGGVEPEFRAVVVDPAQPREKAGLYWGYNVRLASSLSAVFKESPFNGAYDVSIGTSERGQPLHELVYPPVAASNTSFTATNQDKNTNDNDNGETNSNNANSQPLPSIYNHALVVFGGIAGLEAACAADDEMMIRVGGDKMNVGSAFNLWVNAVPGQGSRTIRTEEALFIVLGQLEHWLKSAGK